MYAQSSNHRLLTASSTVPDTAECHIQGKLLRLIYTSKRNDIAPTRFNTLIHVLFEKIRHAGQQFGWDTYIDPLPKIVTNHGWWVAILEFEHPTTWRVLWDMATLVQYCYSAKGHVEEFKGEFWVMDARIANIELAYAPGSA